MALTDVQVRQLRAKLDAKHVKTRNANGTSLHYVEGWHVIAEANRIFGYDAWDRRTIVTNCVWTEVKGGNHHAAYTAKVRVTVRAGDMTVIREGSGTGEATAPTPGQAHELALKGAETDATKRALATFGNPFGLALYDRELNGVRKARRATGSEADKLQAGPWVLRSSTGTPIATNEKPSDFIDALRRAMSEAGDIELLYEVWERNLETVRAVHRMSKDGPGVVPTLVAHLRACAVALVKVAGNGSSHPVGEETPDKADQTRNSPHKIDKSVLTFGEPKRIRSKEHLRFVGSQPCLICGRAPSHPHHLRYAQSRGLSLKVSDEFTVPLCAIHHDHIHKTGKEKEWWQERNIDPLKVAGDLWQQSRERYPAANEAASSESADLRPNRVPESACADNSTTQPDAATAIVMPIDADANKA
jgi:DNA recombination protein Rad52